MLNSKQRAHLSSFSTKIPVTMQIGKDGLSEESFIQVEQMLKKKELIKVRLLNNSEENLTETAEKICKETNCELVKIIGKIMIFYKKTNKPKIII